MLSFRSLEHVWLKIIWLNSSHNPEWKLKASSEAIFRTELRHENAARLLSTVQNGGNDVRIWRRIFKENLRFRC